jgi:hypothetical protein
VKNILIARKNQNKEKLAYIWKKSLSDLCPTGPRLTSIVTFIIVMITYYLDMMVVGRQPEKEGDQGEGIKKGRGS